MSRLAEAMLLATDEQRLAWYQALSEAERADVKADIDRVLGPIMTAFSRVKDALGLVVQTEKYEKFVVLDDVMPDLTQETGKEADAITVKLEILHDGVSVALAESQYDEYRMVLENKCGKLTLHVWATAASIGQDPTHSIEIDPEPVDPNPVVDESLPEDIPQDEF